MSSQMTSRNGEFKRITGVGTAVQKLGPGILQRVLIPGTFIGTVQFDDTATAAGTTASTLIYAVPIPATTVPGAIEIGANYKSGLVYQATGTPTLTFIYT